jgi:hypothetical protein
VKSLNKIILAVAAIVSVLMVVTVYFLFSGFGDRMMQKAAFSQASIVSRLTFSNMFQLMNHGWKRDQVIAFTNSATQSLAGSPLRIEFHRGELVEKQYGGIAQAAMTPELEKALRSGRPQEVVTPSGGRYVYPLLVEESCKSCHEGVKNRQVLGAITVEARYENFIDDTRKLLMIILLILAPAPFIAAWLVTIYLENRIDRFVRGIDTAMERSRNSGESLDFSNVKPAWDELEEILDRVKKVAAHKN